MDRSCNRLKWPWLLLLWCVVGMSAYAAEKISFIHVANLGEVYSGLSEDAAMPTVAEAEKTLKELHRDKPEAIFIDSGNRLNMRAMTETHFSVAPAILLNEMDAIAANFGSRDMIYADPVLAYIEQRGKNIEPNITPFVSSANFKDVPPPFTPKKEIVREAQGKKFRIFGMGIIEPVQAVVSNKYEYVESKNVLEDTISALSKEPKNYDLNLVLSDLQPELNDKLAQSAPPNTLIFEQAMPPLVTGKLPKPLRHVNGIPIVSKQNWWSADEVEVNLRPDGAPGKITISQHNFNPWAGARSSLFPNPFERVPELPDNRKPKVVLPRIDYRLTSYSFLKGLKYAQNKIEEFRTAGIDGEDQRRNKNIYFYRLSKGDDYFDYVQLERTPIPGMITLVFLIGFNKNGDVVDIQDYSSVMLHHHQVNLTNVILPRFFDVNRQDDFYTPDEIYGVEPIAEFVREDLIEAIRLYREAKDQAIPVTDPYDHQDLFE